MTEFFKPYEGRKPYIFVSYSHRDSEKVIGTIRKIHDRHYRLWYDEGIPAGSDWPRNIAVHMQDCRMVLFFLSRTALASPNCLSEISTAAKQEKTILMVRLEEIPSEDMDPRWQSCLKRAVLIDPAAEDSVRAEHILNSPLLTDEFLGTAEDFQNTGAGGGRGSIAGTIAMIIAGLLLFIALSGVTALSTGIIVLRETPSPTPTATPTPVPTPTPTPEPSDPTPTPVPPPPSDPTPTPEPPPSDPTPTPEPPPSSEATPTPAPPPEDTKPEPGNPGDPSEGAGQPEASEPQETMDEEIVNGEM